MLRLLARLKPGARRAREVAAFKRLFGTMPLGAGEDEARPHLQRIVTDRQAMLARLVFKADRTRRMIFDGAAITSPEVLNKARARYQVIARRHACMLQRFNEAFIIARRFGFQVYSLDHFQHETANRERRAEINTGVTQRSRGFSTSMPATRVAETTAIAPEIVQ